MARGRAVGGLEGLGSGPDQDGLDQASVVGQSGWLWAHKGRVVKRVGLRSEVSNPELLSWRILTDPLPKRSVPDQPVPFMDRTPGKLIKPGPICSSNYGVNYEQ